MMYLRNTETGAIHEMDLNGRQELKEAYDKALKYGWNEVVFRAMRIDIEQVRKILKAED